jgi:DNA-binding CsgD family transcriptional regulator
MSRKIHVALAEPSEILRAGMIEVLKRIGILDIYVIEIADVNSFDCNVSNPTPDLLIVNPVATDPAIIRKIRTLTGNNKMKTLALLHSLADRHTLKHYDESVSIYDSAEQIRNKIVKLLDLKEKSDTLKDLSNREKEVIVEVAKGLTNKQIAEKLFLSIHTVMTHRKNIANKLQIHSPSGLTIYAILNNLVDLDQVKQ